MELKKRLRELIMNNRIGESIRVLIAFTKKLDDEKLYNEVITQSSIFKQYKEDRRRNTVSDEVLQLAIARITSSLLEIIDELPENTGKTKNMIWLWVLLTGFLLTSSLIAWQFKSQTNTPRPENEKLELAKTFDLVVQVHGKEGRDDVVLEKEGEVILYLAGERKHASINAFGEAYFENLPLALKSKEIRIQLDADGFVASQPNKKYSLQNETIYFAIEKKIGSAATFPIDRATSNLEMGKTKVTKSYSSNAFNQGFEGNLALLNLAKRSGAQEALESLLKEAQHITSTSFFSSSFLEEKGAKLWKEGAIIFEEQGFQPTLNCICLIYEQEASFQKITKYGGEYVTAKSIVNFRIFYIQSGETQSFSVSTGGAGADSILAYQSLKDNFSIEVSDKNYLKEFDICKK